MYRLIDENQNEFEMKSYELKQMIKKKKIYICNMNFKKGKLIFNRDTNESEDFIMLQSKIPYCIRVDNFLKEENKEPLLVCDHTPHIIMKSANIDNYPIMLNKKKAKEISKKNNEPGHGHHHAVSRVDLLKLPEALNNPKSILVSKKCKNEIIIITTMIKDDSPIIVAIHCGLERRIKSNTYRINKIVSIYPKKFSKKTIAEKYEIKYL